MVRIWLVSWVVVCGCRDGQSNSATSECATADRFGATVVEYHTTGDENAATDPRMAEGAPDCADGGPHDISLGEGGYLVFDLGCTLTPSSGAEFRVWESDGQCPSAISDVYVVSVSQDGEQFIEVARPIGTQDVEVPTGALRYVRIDDGGASSSGASPGADIDALELWPSPR